MNRRLRQFEPRLKPGFTLVELLVAMTIFVILATLTVSGFRANTADRVSAATGTFRNALDGARSRAIKAGEPRGLRLLTDPNDGRLVTSVIYVGAPGFDEGNCIIRSSTAVANTWIVRTVSGTWEILEDRGLLKSGTRIEIPRASGNWYTVMSVNAGSNEVRIAGHYQPSDWNGSRWIAMPDDPTNSPWSGPMRYRLELSPAILPGAEPILLGSGVAIDLDGSVVPSEWRPDSSAPAANYFQRMDILFSPRGTLGGVLQAANLLHFRISYVTDIEMAKNLGNRPLQQGQSAVVPADPEKDHRAVSIYSSTGQIVISEINPNGASDTPGFNNDIAPTPFYYAIRGREAN